MIKPALRVALILSITLAVGATAALWIVPPADAAEENAPSATVREAYKQLFDLSAKEKKGLVLYVDGQQISGVFTRMVGSDAVELRNREVSRLVVRLDRIDAIAAP